MQHDIAGWQGLKPDGTSKLASELATLRCCKRSLNQYEERQRNKCSQVLYKHTYPSCQPNSYMCLTLLFYHINIMSIVVNLTMPRAWKCMKWWQQSLFTGYVGTCTNTYEVLVLLPSSTDFDSEWYLIESTVNFIIICLQRRQFLIFFVLLLSRLRCTHAFLCNI